MIRTLLDRFTDRLTDHRPMVRSLRMQLEAERERADLAEQSCRSYAGTIQAADKALTEAGAPPGCLRERVVGLALLSMPGPVERQPLTASEQEAYAFLTAHPGMTADEIGRLTCESMHLNPSAPKHWAIADGLNGGVSYYYASEHGRRITSLYRKGWATRTRDGATWRYAAAAS